jgi:hypothetical protein
MDGWMPGWVDGRMAIRLEWMDERQKERTWINSKNI